MNYKGLSKAQLIERLIEAEGKLSSAQSSNAAEFSAGLNTHSFEIYDQPTCWFDYEGNYIEANKAACQLLGYTQSELLYLRLMDIDEDLDEKAWREYRAKIKKLGTYVLECIQRTKDGLKIKVESTFHHLNLEGKDYFCAFAQRISREGAVERELKFVKDFSADLIQNAKVIICVIDNDDHFIYINPFMETVSGYTYEELKGQKWIDILFPKEHQLDVRKRFRRLIRDMQTSPETFPIVTKKGEVRAIEWFDSIHRDLDGDVKGYYVIGRDITERKAAQDALQASEILYRSLAENTRDFIMRYDRSGKIIYTNPAGLKLMGLMKEDVIGTTSVELGFREEQLLFWASIIQKALDSGELQQEVFEFEYKDDKIILDLRAIPEQNAEGEFESVLAITRDITELKRAVDEKAKLEELLRQAQKMETIGRLAGGIAHDFNNLLTALLGNCELALRQIEPDHPIHEKLEVIHQAGNSAANLTKQLLSFSRKQTLNPKILNLRDVIKNLEKMLKRVIGEDIRLQTKFPKNLWHIKIDPSQIEQVIFNLLVNARDAMPSGGKLIIKAENQTLKSSLTGRNFDILPGKYILLSIHDTGSGIPQEIVDHIFEPFFTTKRVGEGTGLGLSLVYGIVRQNEGEITVESIPGKSTTFNIYLPAVFDTFDVKTEVDIQEDLPQGVEEILIIEDDEPVRNLASEILILQGYTVVTAGNPEEALKICKARRKPFAMMVSDVIMPGMNGIELYKLISDIWPSIKVLFMSGYAPHTVMRSAIEDLDKPFMQKPFNPKIFTKKVREILDS